jgi:hypothetical protein
VDGEAVVGGQGKGRLAFQVEVLLPADLHGAGQAARRLREGRGRVAPRPDAGAVLEARVRGERVVDGQHGRLGCDLGLAQARGLAGEEVARGRHEEQGLT